MWRALLMLCASVLWAQVVEIKFCEYRLESNELIKSKPLYYHLDSHTVCELAIREGGGISFTDEPTNQLYYQIKHASQPNTSPNPDSKLEKKWRFIITAPENTDSLDDLIWHIQEIQKTDSTRSLYKIDYVALTAEKLKQKFQTSRQNLDLNKIDPSPAAKMIFLEKFGAIGYLSFAVVEEPTIDEQPRDTDPLVPRSGELQPTIDEIQAPFRFDVKYTNSSGGEHIARFDPATRHIGLPIYTRSFNDPQTGEIFFAQYRLFFKLAPFKYADEVLQVELILRAELAVFNQDGDLENLIPSSMFQMLEFEKESVIEAKLLDDWPPAIKLQDGSKWEGSVGEQSLIIRPVKIK